MRSKASKYSKRYDETLGRSLNLDLFLWLVCGGVCAVSFEELVNYYLAAGQCYWFCVMRIVLYTKKPRLNDNTALFNGLGTPE